MWLDSNIFEIGDEVVRSAIGVDLKSPVLLVEVAEAKSGQGILRYLSPLFPHVSFFLKPGSCIVLLAILTIPLFHLQYVGFPPTGCVPGESIFFLHLSLSSVLLLPRMVLEDPAATAVKPFPSRFNRGFNSQKKNFPV